MTAVQMAVVGHHYRDLGRGFPTEGTISHIGGQPEVSVDHFYLPMALCADAEVKDGTLVGDPTEGALGILAAKGGVDPTLTRERYPRVATLPFDAAYKLMATFHRMTVAHGKDVDPLLRQGGTEQLLARARAAIGPDGQTSSTECASPISRRTNNSREHSGLRVLATAQRDFDPATFDPNADLYRSSRSFDLLAVVGDVDPPRAEARDAITRAKSAGIQVRIITGDHAITAEAIARQLGIEGQAITGAQARRHVGRRGGPPDRRYRGHRPRRARGQGPPGRDPASKGPHRGHDRRRRE